MTNEIIIGLKNIALGYIFIMFRINLGTIDILPDFIGYVLIYKGIKILLNIVTSLKLLQNFAVLLGVISFIKWILAIFNSNIRIYLISVIITIITLYFDFQLITDIMEIATKSRYLHVSDLKLLRNMKVIIYTVIYLMTYFFINETIMVILIFIQLGICLLIVYMIYDLAKWIEKNNFTI